MKRFTTGLSMAFAAVLASAHVGCSGQADRVAGEISGGKTGSLGVATSDQSKSASVGLCALFTTKEMEDLPGPMAGSPPGMTWRDPPT